MDTRITYLANKNKHERDDLIEFEEASHKYTILCDKNSQYTSVTTFIHDQFEKFDADLIIGRMMDSPHWCKSKYYGKRSFEIKALWDKNRDSASSSGTRMHYMIECFYNNIPLEEEDLSSIEYKYFKSFHDNNKHLVAFRTEWTVFDFELKLAGSIDMVFYNKNTQSYYIYDWKRCREIKKANSYNKYSTNPILSDIPDTNYWHYTLQLNIYKYLLEKNYNIKIAGCVLVCIHPENKNNTYKLYTAPFLDDTIAKMFEERKLDVITNPHKYISNVSGSECAFMNNTTAITTA
jgi:hypothetical protein